MCYLQLDWQASRCPTRTDQPVLEFSSDRIVGVQCCCKFVNSSSFHNQSVGIYQQVFPGQNEPRCLSMFQPECVPVELAPRSTKSF